ncbi:M10 family metallopeptidase C-terminal domain-containing protein [Bradyrhizobium ottawaense]|uniref:M10 family metallopeptidase C-terminal domain-containing protein n=1 Tax=Bradyrhizobium ottawaense TaxID=931866 RepID=UPI002ADF2FD7|nr:M10 family metallopeptidase C-terminal domain-containing protein [Bradyrhizobium ottawaense]WQN81264.1 M10 family metallopeptidase C-terminal domain-containing protein [Bradyrhizobium ottawaense]
MATAVLVSKTNNADIDGLLSGYKWTGTITYSFPDLPSDYASSYTGGSSEPTASGFAWAPTQMQAAINYAIGLINGYTNANIQYVGTNGADIMIAQSPAANPTSYAYYPGNYAAGGDIWFGTQYNYSQAILGNYYFATALHELGHAVGLKHSQEIGGPANVAVPTAHDDSEYTVMSYRSYVGASTTGGYTNEAYGYSQTYMANDILALQTMYGADYTTQNGNTVYTWNPTTGQEFINGVGQLAPGGGVGGSANRIYETVWDGGGVDTYDLSNYTTNLSINLNPGASSVFSSVQLAYLGDGHYASGNVYNAYLYNGDARSYIDNAIGGSGSDIIVGNAIANVLNGGGGNDTITGGGGNDTITGGRGNDVINGGLDTDTAVYSGNRANYIVSYNAGTQTFTISDQRAGSPEGIDSVTGVEHFQFADRTIAGSSLILPIVIEATGSTKLDQIGSYYFLDPVSGGTGPSIKLAGTPFAASTQVGAWTPIGAEQTANGYQIAWKVIGADQYAVWNADSTGNYVSSALAVVAGGSEIVEAFESSFQQDLNADGVIGIPAAIVHAVEAAGSTKLDQIGSYYFLDPVSGGTGPSIKLAGTPFAASTQVGAWTPIGTEQTANGYQIAWKVIGADQYAVWNADSNGNYVSSALAVVAGGSEIVEAFESSFQQDLNADGVIGIPAAIVHAVEAAGSTKLDQIGSYYFLDPVSGGRGPSVKLAGTPFAASTQVGAWTPIGTEQTANGYQIAWKVIGADQYAVWNADSNGNYVSSASAVVAGGSEIVEAFESSFQQDLNADGVIGIPAAIVHAVEAAGSTKLDQIGSYYFLDPVSGGRGPSVKLAGTPFAASTQVGAWTPIGAEQTANGYQIAWKVIGADQYAVWNADSNGNYIADVIGGVSGASSALKGLQASFHQDLNGDAVIGDGTSVIEAFGSTSLADHDFNLNSFSNSTGSALKYGSAVPETDQYNFCDANSSGNPQIGVTSFSRTTLETLGLSFPQDFTPTSPGIGIAGGNDLFVLHHAISGGGAIAESTEIVAPEGSTIVAICKQLIELLHESPGNQAHAFRSACDFHDTLIGRDLAELHLADLNAGYVVVR